MKIWIPALFFVCLAVAMPSAAQNANIYTINGRIPLGIESFRLQPAGREFYLMASVESPAFEGLYRATDRSGQPHLFNASSRVMFYPARIQFRLTASTREKLVDDRPFDTHAKLSVNDMLTKLHFRMKVFHALEYRYIKPTFIDDIGIPNDVPYDERIYRIGFDLGKIPIEDRVVMEVISPTGERLCKFHLDLL